MTSFTRKLHERKYGSPHKRFTSANRDGNKIRYGRHTMLSMFAIKDRLAELEEAMQDDSELRQMYSNAMRRVQ